MKKFSKFLAIVLSIAITVPMLALSAGAIDSLTVEEPQIISDTLQAVMEANTEETTRVAVWLKDIETEEALATNSMPSYQERLAAVTAAEANSTAKSDVDRSIEVKRTALNLCYEPYTESVGTSYFTDDEIVYASEYLPIVLADLTDERVAEVAELDVVEMLDFYCDDVENSESELSQFDIDASIGDWGYYYYTVSENLTYINGNALKATMNSSSDVSIGVLDSWGFDTGYSGTQSVDVHLHHSNVAVDPISYHPNRIIEIIAGVAPYADFYYGTYVGSGSTFVAEMDWFVDCGVNIISASMGIRYVLDTPYEAENTYGSIPQLIDQYVYLYGITFVKSAGNWGRTGINSGGMSYNAIVVGNFNRTTGEAAPNSSYYEGNVLAYKPDISAPGFLEFSDGFQDYATSYSTPLISGIVAAAMAYDEDLKEAPATLIKAMLTASTLDDFSYVPDTSEYQKLGAGVIDAAKFKKIIDDGTYVNWMANDTIYGGCSFEKSLQAGKDVRISLAFAKANTTSTNYSLPNLNLFLYGVGDDSTPCSTTSNNNVEILTTPIYYTDSYEIFVQTVSVPTYNNSTTVFTFSLAWVQY